MDQLGRADISIANYKQRPQEVGKILVDVVKQWHTSAAAGENTAVDLSKSCYLVLSWNGTGLYQLHQFALTLPNPEQLHWYFPTKTINGQEKIARHINGDDMEGRVFEWYSESGGQLKFYPKASSALWQSETFELEPLPNRVHSVLAKVQAYFPELWAKAALTL